MFSEIVTSACVGAGSWLPSPSNMFLKTGTMKTSIRITATNDITSTITGYAIADLIAERSLDSFS